LLPKLGRGSDKPAEGSSSPLKRRPRLPRAPLPPTHAHRLPPHPGPPPARLTLHHKRVLKDDGGQAVDEAVEGLARDEGVVVHIHVDLEVVGACVVQ
jgi:hypothetical protein